MHPKVSAHPAAVIVHYRHQELTARCLESLLSHCPDLKAIYVVDNSPESESLNYLQQRFQAAIICWLPQPENLGFGAGCNAGIQAALSQGADSVLLINNDAWVKSDIVKTFAQASARYHHKAILSGRILTPEGQIWYAGGNYSLYTARTFHNLSSGLSERRVAFISGCLMWLPAQILNELQGFAKNYFLYLEDLELCLRAQQAGFGLVYLPEVSVYHQVSSSTGGRDHPRSVYYQNRNRLLLMLTHARFRHWLIFLPFYLLGYLKRLRTPSRKASQQALRDALRGHWGRQDKL